MNKSTNNSDKWPTGFYGIHSVPHDSHQGKIIALLNAARLITHGTMAIVRNQGDKTFNADNAIISIERAMRSLTDAATMILNGEAQKPDKAPELPDAPADNGGIGGDS